MIKIISEIGWNHMGDMKLAEKMVQESKRSGANIAKFQYWNPEKLKNGPWDNDGRIDIYKKAFLTEEKIKIIQDVCLNTNIEFLISVFDINDAKFIRSLNINKIKIPSHEAYNLELIEYALSSFDYTIISTGALFKNELYELKEITKKYQPEKYVILHCVSAYPCEIKNSNIIKILRLKNMFNQVGFSDHTQSVLLPSLAVALGAKVIEKHFTIDNNLPGRDNKFALEPKKFKQMCSAINDAFESLNDLGDDPQDNEMDIIKNYRGRWSRK